MPRVKEGFQSIPFGLLSSKRHFFLGFVTLTTCGSLWTGASFWKCFVAPMGLAQEGRWRVRWKLWTREASRRCVSEAASWRR